MLYYSRVYHITLHHSIVCTYVDIRKGRVPGRLVGVAAPLDLLHKPDELVLTARPIDLCMCILSLSLSIHIYIYIYTYVYIYMYREIERERERERDYTTLRRAAPHRTALR